MPRGRPKKINNTKQELKENNRNTEQENLDIIEKDEDVYPADKQEFEAKEIHEVKPVETSDEFDVDKLLNINLSEEEQDKIAKEICSEIKKSIDLSSELYDNIDKWNDMYECIKDDSKNDDPWDDAYNTRSGNIYVAVKGKTVRYMQSLFGIEPFCIIKKAGNDNSKELQDKVKSIEDWFQFLQTKIIHTPQKSKNLLKSVTKDGTGFAELYWDRKVKREQEIASYDNENDFVKDFPDNESAGVSQEQYNKYIDKLKLGNSIYLFVNSYKEQYNAPMFDIPERKDIIFVPNDIRDIEKAIGICRRFWLTWDDLKQREARGLYFNIDKVKEYKSKSELTTNDSNQNEIEGKSEDLEDNIKTKPIEMFKCLYNYDINGDGMNERCIFIISYKEQVMVQAKYWANNLFYIPFYIEERANRIDGIGTSQIIENDNDELDEIKRLRINSAKMVCSPIFKAKIGSNFDPTKQKIYPGVVWWMENPDDASELHVSNNMPELYTEQQILQKDIEMKSGYNSGLSGRESPQDPTAPAAKTIALLRESNMIINDDIVTLRFSFEELFFRMIDMCSRYLDDDDKYLKLYGLKKEDLKIAKENIELKGISVTSNKEIKKQEDLQVYTILMQNPIIMQNPQAMRYLTETLVNNWNLDKSKLVPTEEEMREQQVQTTMEAMRRLKEQDEINMKVAQLRERGVPDNQIKQILMSEAAGGQGQGMPQENMQPPIAQEQQMQNPNLTGEEPVF